jgi:UDP-GlcNAc:undecaprenyl-phosphate GlcNAc-1-phosphate transferase
LAFRYNAVALVRVRDVHTKPVPYFGGVAMLGGLAWPRSSSPRNCPGSADSSWCSATPGSSVVLGGDLRRRPVVDDLFELGAAAKLSGEVLAAGIVVLNGVKFYWIPLPDRIIALDNVASIALAVFVILFCTNAINLDGWPRRPRRGRRRDRRRVLLRVRLPAQLRAGSRAGDDEFADHRGAGGVCLGFLPHNVHKARMFMGDSGALLLGFLLATSVISLTGQLDPVPREPPAGERCCRPICPCCCRSPSWRCRSSTWSAPTSAAPWRAAVVRGRQAAPAPPHARTGAQPRARGGPAVAVGGRDRLRRGGASASRRLVVARIC